MILLIRNIPVFDPYHSVENCPNKEEFHFKMENCACTLSYSLTENDEAVLKNPAIHMVIPIRKSFHKHFNTSVQTETGKEKVMPRRF